MINRIKKLLFPALLLLVKLTFGQTNYYTFNDGILVSEDSIKLIYENSKQSIPSNYIANARIFHRIAKSDSIINYLTFDIIKNNDSSNTNKEFNPNFIQDSLYLFLNKKLPEFKLRDLNGNEFSSSQLIGKPTLLNFWAIYCVPCVAEIPELNGLKEKYEHQMNFIALTENTCKKDDLANFLVKHPFNFQILQNAQNYEKTLKISQLPYNIFIDREGYIRYIQRNFPYTAFNSQKGIKEFDKNNYFTKIIEELIKKQ